MPLITLIYQSKYSKAAESEKTAFPSGKAVFEGGNYAV
jgi:hypothetical protein